MPERLIRVKDIIGNAETRKLCGIKSRATLIAWRKDRSFPAPIVELGQGEVWDASEVRAWLKAQK